MTHKKPVVSVVTPSYNRSKQLTTCFESLVKQTCYEFEWIIVDDGSSDNTQSVIKNFHSDLFTIKYIVKENGGKHTALNAAHPLIEGQYVLILDSDDYLIPEAIEEVIIEWRHHSDNQNIGVLTFLRGESINHPLCKARDEDEGKTVDIVKYNRVKIVSGDACEVIRTELFLKYPFPEFRGERFVAENALWSRVALTHKCIYINRVIYICHYLDGGLTDSGRKMRIQNPQGGMYTSNLEMHKRNFLRHRIKNSILFVCYGYFAGELPKSFSKKCDWKAMMHLCLPVGWVVFQVWRRKYNVQIKDSNCSGNDEFRRN